MSKKAIFGTAGVPLNFSNPPYKGNRIYFFDWLRDLGLNAYEVQCNYGFANPGFPIEQLITAAKEGINLSIHAPYYTNLGSLKPLVVKRGISDLITGIRLAQQIGAKRIVFHPGGGHGNGENARENAIKQIIDSLLEVEKSIDLKDVKLCPEVGGTISALGSLDEIIEICKNVKSAYPCIDFAHLHARELGSLKTKEDFLKVFRKIESQLGREKLENMHIHCYTIAYSKAGEIRHLEHGEISPLYANPTEFLDNFIFAIKEMNFVPWIISEAKETQEIGAIYLRDKYNE